MTNGGRPSKRRQPYKSRSGIRKDGTKVEERRRNIRVGETTEQIEERRRNIRVGETTEQIKI